MNKILLSIVIASGSYGAFGATYTIKALNSPELIVNGKTLRVGDSFGDDAVIQWSNQRQAAKLLSSDNKVIVMSGEAYSRSGAKKFKDFLATYKTMSSRGDGYPSSVEDHASEMTGRFVLLDEICFPTAWASDEKNYFAVDTPEGLKRLTVTDGNIVIDRETLGNKEGETRLKIVYVEEDYGDTTTVADDMVVVMMPVNIE